jgi:hypothetical protein
MEPIDTKDPKLSTKNDQPSEIESSDLLRKLKSDFFKGIFDSIKDAIHVGLDKIITNLIQIPEWNKEGILRQL